MFRDWTASDFDDADESADCLEDRLALAFDRAARRDPAPEPDDDEADDDDTPDFEEGGEA